MMQPSFLRLHLQLPTHSYGPLARTSTQTDPCSASPYPSPRLLTPMLARVWATPVRAQTEAWTSTSLLLLHSALV